MSANKLNTNRPPLYWVFLAIMFTAFTAVVLLAPASRAHADTNDSFLDWFQVSAAEQRNLYLSLYTKHYDPDPNHVNDQQMLGFEFQMTGRRLWGFAMFDNSFGQSSQYLYVGKNGAFMIPTAGTSS